MSLQQLKLKKLQKRVDQLEAQKTADNLRHMMEMESLNKNWSTKISIVVGMFEAALKQAGTIGEARRWFEEWSNDINNMEPDELIAKHGFEFELQEVETDYREEMK